MRLLSQPARRFGPELILPAAVGSCFPAFFQEKRDSLAVLSSLDRQAGEVIFSFF